MDPKFHLELDPAIIEQCDEIRAIASKKWTNASSVSLAKLDQIKTKVYTIGLNDARNLRPPSCLSNHRDKENKPLVEEFKTEPQLLTLDYQKTAWGSNTSIPELLKQQTNRTRPVTSHTQSRTRPWSGKRPNTTSGITKPPIGPAKSDLTAPISVRGAKCDATTGKVLTPHTVDDWSNNNGNSSTTERYQDSPRAPVPSPDFTQDKVDGRRSGRKSPMVLLRKPTPEPLHLQLPSMGIISDEDEDDDLDTERLLEKATDLSSKSNNVLLNGSSEFLHSHDLDINDRERKRSEVIGKVTEAFGETKHVETENTHKSPNVLFREDRNRIIDISPRQPNSRSRPVSATKKRSDQKIIQKANLSRTYKPGVDNNRSQTSRQSSSESEHFDPIVVSVRIPAEQTEDAIQRGKLSSNKLRVDSDSSNGSGTQKPTSPITVINIGSSEQTTIPESSRGFRSVSTKRVATGQRPVTPAATIVTVDYGEDSSRTCELAPSEDLNKHDNSAKSQQNGGDAQKTRPVSTRLNHYEQSLKSNTNEKVFKTTKTLEFDLTGAKDTSVKSALDGECYKPTEPKSVSEEHLKKLKQTRPPAVRKSCKIKSPPPTGEDVSTLNVVENLPHDVSYKGTSFKINDPNFQSQSYFDPSIGVKFLMFRQKSGNVRTMPINIKIKTESLEAELIQPKTSYARAKSAPVRPKWHSAKKGRSLFGTEEEKPKITKEKKPVNPEDILNIVSKNPDFEKFESQEKRECQYMKDKLARNGINVTTATLERALYPPTGKTLYYDVPGYLPATYSSSLLSHPRVWMPENYKRFKEAEKQLDRANHMLWLQKREEERDDPGFKPIKPKPKSLLTTRKTTKSAKKRKKVKKPTLKRSQSFG